MLIEKGGVYPRSCSLPRRAGAPIGSREL